MLNRLQGVFASFQKHDVKYLVIGGIASILYGVPRSTFDLDIYQHQMFFVVSREDLIASKRAAGRKVDLEDVRLLELPESE